MKLSTGHYHNGPLTKIFFDDGNIIIFGTYGVRMKRAISEASGYEVTNKKSALIAFDLIEVGLGKSDWQEILKEAKTHDGYNIFDVGREDFYIDGYKQKGAGND